MQLVINTTKILNDFISLLNSKFEDYLFIRNFNINNKPPYPYITVGITTPYIPVNENNRPNIVLERDDENNAIKRIRKEQPQMVLSINIFSENEEESFDICMAITSALKFIYYDEFSERGIIILNTTNPRNLTGILEVDYEYRWQFDCRVRVNSELVMTIDATQSIELTDETIDKTTIIK